KAQELGFEKVKKFSRLITFIVNHITAVGNSTFEKIRQGHLNRGWKDIGYHFLILGNGDTYEGRDIEVIGSHVEGYNVGSIGIAFDHRGSDTNSNAKYGDYITEAQQRSLERLNAYL